MRRCSLYALFVCAAVVMGVSASAYGVNYYVNDSATTGDVYCTAVGSAFNTGLSPGDPYDSISTVLGAYDLGPGDNVYVDTGTYSITSNITVSSADGGDATNPVTFYGAGYPETFIDRNDTGVAGNEYVFVFADNAAYYVDIRDMDINNGDVGIHISGGASNISIYNNHIWDHAGDGIYADVASNLTIHTNKIHCNLGYGIRLLSVNTATVYNNMVYNQPTGNEVYLATGSGSQSQSINFYNNTLYRTTSGYCLYANDVNGLTLTNNILQNTLSSTGGDCMAVIDTTSPSLTSDYNNFSCVDVVVAYNSTNFHSNLASWQGETISPDANSISSDPLFVDVLGTDGALGLSGASNGVDDDFHLQSTYESYHLADGWIADASDSPSIDAGDPSDTYTTEPAPAGPAINQGAYGNTSTASKTVGWWYFVNDSATTNDVYCSAVGNSGNNGLKASTPLDTVGNVLSAYDIEPGATIYVDTGSYSDVFAYTDVTDVGTAALPVNITGSTYNNNRGTLYSISTGHRLSVSYVNVTNLAIQDSASYGITIEGNSVASSPLIGVDISDCAVYGNSSSGIYVNGSSATVQEFSVTNNTVYSNTYGIFLDGSWSSGDVNNNLCYGNASAQIYAGTLLASGGTVNMYNNTCYNTTSSEGIWLSSIENMTATLRNNISYVNYTSGYPIYVDTTNITYTGDYNNWLGGGYTGNWQGTAQSTLADWQTASSNDASSISSDPLFVSPTGPDGTMGGTSFGADDDFHLQSTAGSYHNGSWTADSSDSPSIDAGSPSDPYSSEPSPNGSRINQGAYGYTEQASYSPEAAGSAPTVTAISPTYGPVAGGTSVTITGTNFESGTIGEIGSASLTSVTYVDATTLTAATGAGSAGMFDLWISTSNGSDTLTSAFLYYSSTSDYDSDGMPDAWEATYGLSLTTDDSATDTDGDGESNGQEYIDGTDPTDASSVLDKTAPACPMTILVYSTSTSVALTWPASTSSDLAGYKVYVSTDGGSTWDAGTDVGNVLTHTVTGLTNGGEYRFRVTAYDEVPNESGGIYLDVVVGEGGITVTTSITAGSTAASYRMISFPVVPGTDLFTELQSQLGTYDPAVWRLFRYSSGSYLESTSAGTITPGYSYWILSTVPMDLSFAGGVVTDTYNYPVLLKPGWNQIANPFRNSVDWSTVLVYNPSDSSSIHVTDTANTLTSTTYWVYGHSGYTSSTTMLPFGGGWLYSNASTDLQLLIPVPTAGAKPSAGQSPAQVIQPQSPEETPPSPPGHNLSEESSGGGGCFIQNYMNLSGKENGR